VSDELLKLSFARQEVRNAALAAMLAESCGDAASVFTAWKTVDDAAASLTRARRRYDRHVREVCRNAGRVTDPEE
jgi:hypothetical protein